MSETLARQRFGDRRWNDIKKALGWKGNFISGYRVYVVAWSEPARGRHSATPAHADSGLQWLAENGFLRPSRLAIQPERAPFVGVIGYNQSYIRTTLTSAPVPGHFVDWDFEVLFDVDKHPPHWAEGE